MQIINDYLGNPFLIGREEITEMDRKSRNQMIMVCMYVILPQDEEQRQFLKDGNTKGKKKAV